MADSIEIEFAMFTPAEAESITGVNGMQQRALRRHGYLPSGKGWMRFSLKEAARLLIIESCRKSGIPPATGSLAASVPRATDFLLAFAAEMRGAIDGAALLPAHKLPLRLPRDQQRRFLAVHGTGETDYIFTGDLKKLWFSETEIGAFVVVDLKALAGKLVDGAGRPLVIIKERETERERRAV
jgi:hypothetical protein